LVVPADWRTWDWYFERARDAVNDFLSLVDKLPSVDVGRLPEGSLADLVVKPFCGDWDRIARQADACVIAADAMDGLALNVALVPLDLGRDWWGEASVAAVAHVDCYAVATRGMAEVVASGREAFVAASWMSRRVGETAIRLLVAVGRLLVRLAAKLASRFGGWVAWARAAAEILEEGLGPVRDIYDDVRRLVRLVDDLVALRDLVTEWVAEARSALGVMRGLPDLVERLPRLGSP